MALFQLGKFVLHSGATSDFKVDCDALTTDDWLCVAEMVRKIAGPFSTVTGVPPGGLKMADALRPYCSRDSSHPHLIVDDVLTSGGSMSLLRDKLAEADGESVKRFIGCVLFARSARPMWVNAVWTLNPSLWLQDKGSGI